MPMAASYLIHQQHKNKTKHQSYANQRVEVLDRRVGVVMGVVICFLIGLLSYFKFVFWTY